MTLPASIYSDPAPGIPEHFAGGWQRM